MDNPKRATVSCVRALRLIPALVALLQPITGAAGDATAGSYAPLVRRVAPSVVTVIVEEQSIGAGERAAVGVAAAAREGERHRRVIPRVQPTPRLQRRQSERRGRG